MWIKHFESTSLLSQAEVHFGCSSSCASENRITLNPWRTTTQSPVTKDTRLTRRGTGVRVGAQPLHRDRTLSPDRISPSAFVQRKQRPRFKQPRIESTCLFSRMTISFVFYLCFSFSTSHPVLQRCRTSIPIDGLTEYLQFFKKTNVQKCGKTIGSLKPRSEKM